MQSRIRQFRLIRVIAVPQAAAERSLEPLLESWTGLPGSLLAHRPRGPESATTTAASSGSRGCQIHSIQRDPCRIFRREIYQHRRQRRVVLEVIEHDLVEGITLGMPGD